MSSKHNPHAMGSFTRGSQIFMHTLRMLSQGTKVAFNGSCIAVLIWFSYMTHCHVRMTDLFYFAVERYGTLKAALLFELFSDSGANLSVYDFTLKIMRHVCVSEYKRRIWGCAIGARLMEFEQFLKHKALVQAGLVFGSSMILIYLFFVLRGRQATVKQKSRGGELMAPKVLAKQLRRAGQDSPIVLGSLPLVRFSERQHILITGTTGTGKTNLLHELLPQIRARGDRAIVVDVTGFLTSSYFDPQRDLLLNPLDQRSQKWLPWADCDEDFDFLSMAAALVGKPSHQDSFWEESAKKIISQTLLETREEASLAKVLQILNAFSLKEYSSFFEKSCVAGITSMEADKTTLSIRATIGNKIHPLGLLQETNTPFSIKKFVCQEHNPQNPWLFLTSLPAQRQALAPLQSLWVDLALTGLMSRCEESKNLWILMDELPAMGNIPSLKTALAESRKYGGCLVAGIQNIHQCLEIYGGTEGKNILDQFNTRFYFRVGDGNTASMISQSLGEQETIETQESLSYGANTMKDGVNLNTLERKKPLVMPTELLHLEDLSAYAKLAGHWPISKLKFPYHQPPRSDTEGFVPLKKFPR